MWKATLAWRAWAVIGISGVLLAATSIGMPRGSGASQPTPSVLDLSEDVVVSFDPTYAGSGSHATALQSSPLAVGGGFTLMQPGIGIRQEYTVTVVADHPEWWRLQGPVETAAAHLTAATGASYQLGPPKPTAPAGDGEIVVSFSSGPKCAPAGCAHLSWMTRPGEGPEITKADIWVNPTLISSYGLLLQIVMHELGHAAGLGHYVIPFEGQIQLMYPTAYEWDPILAYRSGDLNGFTTVAHNGYRQPCPPFSDVFASNPFCEDIAWMEAEGIALGFRDGTFHPAEGLTRQAMAAFLYRMAGEPEPSQGKAFHDVLPSHPFYEAITWMASTGIAEGFADGGFHPGEDLTRQAMAAFLYRMAGSPASPVHPATFIDVTLVNAFLGPIGWMASTGITNGFGDGTFRPTARLTRQAMAAFLHRFHDLH